MEKPKRPKKKHIQDQEQDHKIFKFCTACQIEKKLSDFYRRSPPSRNIRFAECKECFKSRRKKAYDLAKSQ